MEVILLEKIPNLGQLGDRVHVKPGYGRNYLVPKGKAVIATPAKIAEFEQRRAELEKLAAEKLAAAQARAEALAKLGTITLRHKAGEEGKLFGSIGTHAIAEALTQAGVAIQRQEVRLPHGPIRQVGEYAITIDLHHDVTAEVPLQVVAE